MDRNKEASIAAGLKAGDAGAWAEFYEACIQSVWSEVSRRLGPRPHDVADVVQDVFVDAARGARHYCQANGTFSQWLHGIVRNKVALYWRRKARETGFTSEEEHRLFAWLDGHTDTAPDILESAELCQAVRITLSRMPAEYETILRAKYQKGQTAVQIADELETTVESVRSKLKRARRLFRQRFPRDQAPVVHDEM